MNKKISSPADPADISRRLTAVRDALLQLHKALMESERISYERTFGKIQTPFLFLKLLTEDPWFAWFRPVSQLIAAMDEALDAKEPLTAATADSLMTSMKTLLVPTMGGEGFSQHYDEALQRDPDVVFAHAALAKLLRLQSSGTP